MLKKIPLSLPNDDESADFIPAKQFLNVASYGVLFEWLL